MDFAIHYARPSFRLCTRAPPLSYARIQNHSLNADNWMRDLESGSASGGPRYQDDKAKNNKTVNDSKKSNRFIYF